jgi:uncharacterized protein YcnI
VKRTPCIAFLCVALTAAATMTVQAHVAVFPSDLVTTAPACGTLKFVVRVPTEKPIPTTGLRLQIPANVTVIAVAPKPPWHADFATSKGRIVAISWSGGKIMPREFEEFAFLAAAPKQTGTVNWDARQTYQDGSTVAWTGGPQSDDPHSQTVFTAARGACGKPAR